MSEIDLGERFPEMELMRSAPSLFTVNGCGLAMYGGRDHDEETGTYVKTRCLCFLFVPLMALNAFRVANAQQGWYFVGKVPLSGVAKLWNAMAVSCVLAGVGFWVWQSYLNSPDAVAARKLDEARELAKTGQPAEAARLYREVALGGTKYSEIARDGFGQLLSTTLSQTDPQQAATMLEEALKFKQAGGSAEMFVGVVKKAVALAEQHAGRDLDGAVAVLKAAAPFGDEAEQQLLSQTRVGLLKQLIAQQPNNLDAISELAVLHEADGDLEACEQLLAPHAKDLGTREAARVLGQIHSSRDEFEAAQALLGPYAEARLDKLHKAETALNEIALQTHERLIGQLSGGEADADFYSKYESASEPEQAAMVEEWLFARIKQDPALLAAQEEYATYASVVPVALDLAVVQLRYAQALTDPKARRAELERAEKTFLAVKGSAGESDEYRLYLGQVYYWLGKHDRGRELFDQAIAGNPESFDLKMSVGSILREVGAESESRKLAEQAYESADDKDRKYTAAVLRAMTAEDLDDKIRWLQRSDTADGQVRALLSSSRAQKAVQEGRDDDAGRLFQQAIDIYESRPESPGTLNNAALEYMGLFQLTGDRTKFQRGLELMERCVALQPSDSVVLYNTASFALAGAVQGIIGEQIDLTLLKSSGGLELLPYLYRTSEQRQSVVENLKSEPEMAKAVGYFEKVLLLAPKGTRAYGELSQIHGWTSNAAALGSLLERLSTVELDQSDAIRTTREVIEGTNDEKYLKSVAENVARLEKTITAAREKNAPAFAVAVGDLLEQQVVLSLLGEPVEVDQLVSLVEEAEQSAASVGTRFDLIGVLCFRCDLQLIEQDTAYAELAARVRRTLGSIDRLCAALDNEGLRDLVLPHPDFQRAVELTEQQIDALPEEATITHWEMFRYTNSEMAGRVADIVRRDEARRINRSVAAKLNPLSASTAMAQYWSHMLAGEPEEGLAALERVSSQGVPLPMELP